MERVMGTVVWHGAKWREAEPPVVMQATPRAEKGEIRGAVLSALADGQPRSMSALQENTRRGYHAVRDTVRELVEGGHVERVDMGRSGIRYRVIR